MTVEEVIKDVKTKRVKRVCLTGGEPLIQPQAEIQDFLDRLALENYEVSIETSGSIALAPFTLHDRQRWILDMKTPSSGESQAMLFESLALLRPVDEVKFVVGDKPDFDWSVDLIREYSLEGRAHLLFSPTFGAVSPLELTTWVLDSGIDARVQIQLHKIIWDPATRGV